MQRRDFAVGGGYSYHAVSASTSFTKKKTTNNQTNREKFMEKVEVWVCKICDKDYTSKSSLNRHISTAHEQPKPRAIAQAPAPKTVQRAQQGFFCRQCGGEYSTQGNLNRHVSTVHEKPRCNNMAVSNSTKMVQKNKTNVTINVYNPVTYNRYNNGPNW